ncbi:MAG: DUF47 family protein [Candidatus Lokiarchaeota archaeon]|nr:DUF47 family protein [Candidatus Lokiarchaeota archaeon]
MPTETEILKEQLDILVEATNTLATAINNWCESDPKSKSVQEEAQKVITLEKKGDRVEEKFIEYLYKGGAVHFSKTDKLTLSAKIDKILNMEELVARYLMAQPKSILIEKTVSEDIKKLSNSIVKTIETLRECVLLINKDFDEAKRYSRKVEDERREARNLEWKILNDLLNLKELNVHTLLIKQIVELYVMVADKAESLADFIDTIVIKYSTLR